MSANEPEVPVVYIDDIPISRLSAADTLAQLGSWMHSDASRHIATANVDFLRMARKNAELKALLKQSPLTTADGRPLVMMSRWMGKPIPERVTGSDMVAPLCALAAAHGKSVYLLGGTDGVAQAAGENLMAAIPGLEICGTGSTRVRLDDHAGCLAIADEVRQTGADVVFLALGAPKQEFFGTRYGSAMDARLTVGVGASLDFIVGKVSRAPAWVQRMGMEWIHRALSDPKRLGPRYMADIAYLAGLTTRLRASKRRNRAA